MKYLIFTLLALITASVAAQDNPADRIAPYLTDTAVAVARVDLQQVDLAANQDTLQTLLSIAQRDPRRAEAIGERLATLKERGFSELFLVADLAEVHNDYGYLVLPIHAVLPKEAVPPNPNGAKPPESGHGEFELIDDKTVIFGSKQVREHFRSKPTVSERPQLANAFEAHSEASFQLVIVPSQDQRRVLREMLPDLSGEFGNVTGVELADGFQWLSLGIRDSRSLTLTINTNSEDDAQALQKVIAATLRQLATNEQLLETVPQAAEFAEILVPERDGATLKLTAEQTSQVTTDVVTRTVEAARADVKRRETVDNLKQFGLAMHNFHDTYKSFPPSASYDDNGKPLLSWRVFVLPWLEESKLYEEFHLDEPWDSEHNKKLIERMPEVFKSPRTPTEPGMTVFQVLTGKDLLFHGKAGKKISDMTDGTSNTFMIVETTAEAAVPWTKPDDLEVNPEKPLAGLVENRDGFWTTFGDGSVRFISRSVNPEVAYDAMTRAGGEVIPSENLQPVREDSQAE